MHRFQNRGGRLKSLLLVLVLATGQVVTAIPPFFSVQNASAAPICTNDIAGANDEPGQKDLTLMCVDYANEPTTISTSWNWDELGTNGNNTMDACNLFDTDGDNNANYSVCVTTEDTPATFQTLTTYSCGDDKADRCTAPATVISSGTTSCAVTQSNDQPFTEGNSTPKDTKGTCIIQLAAVGGGTAELIDVCSYPSGQPNSDPSDCIVATTKETVELIKQIEPGTDTTSKFNLYINGVKYVTDGGDNSTTGPKVIDEKDALVIKEDAGTGTTLSNYSTTVLCVNDDNVTLASGSVTGSPSREVTINASLIDRGDDITCTFTNTRAQGTITLIKSVTNNNGGNAVANDFGLSIGGTSVTSGQTLTLDPGSYAINEAGLTGYGFVSITGTGCPTTLGGNVNLASNQNITCTITNDDVAPTLTVIKNVVNDNGGNNTVSSFDIENNTVDLTFDGGVVNGSTTTYTSTPTVAANTNYTLSEVNVAGYTEGTWSCTDGTQGTGLSATVNLNEGENVTCTITNNDAAPTLTVIKNVVNDSGGTATVTAFDIENNDVDLTFDGGVANGTTTAYTSTPTVLANTSYTLSEIDVTGYSEGTWSCTDNTNGTGLTVGVNLDEGENVTCTITNNDIPPKLIVVKTVTNDNGGNLTVAEVPLFIDNLQVTSGAENTLTAGVQYTVSETPQTGYTPGTWGGDCAADGTITLVVGQVATCTINNDDIAPTLTIVKEVVNDNGGNAVVSEFDIELNDGDLSFGAGSVNGTKTTYTSTPTVLSNTAYTISEADVAGYTEGTWSCTNGVNGTGLTVDVNLSEGQSVTCTITNNDVAPTLTIEKQVVNDDGGTADVSNFDIKMNNSALTFGAGVTVGSTTTYTATPTISSNTDYTLSEINFDGYTEGTWSCTDNTNGTGLTAAVNLNEGENVTCSITNNDQPANLTLVKDVINDNGGDATQDQWTLSASNITTNESLSGNDNTEDDSTGVNGEVDAGTYTLNETNGPGGYDWTDISCDGRSLTTPTVTVASGQNVTCVFTNDDQDLKLNIVKTNNRPNPTTNGDTVTYTLVVSLPADSGTLFRVKTQDLPPKGFAYVNNSWTAVSTIRGNLKAAGITPEPTYGSPGEWELGTMVPGEVVTLSYQAAILSTASAGTYPDIAFATGCADPESAETCDDSAVLSNVHQSEGAEPFVGTEVTLAAAPVVVPNITKLVNTGQSPINAYAAAALILMMAAVIAATRRDVQKGGKK